MGDNLKEKAERFEDKKFPCRNKHCAGVRGPERIYCPVCEEKIREVKKNPPTPSEIDKHLGKIWDHSTSG